jgi:hypothetical protein
VNIDISNSIAPEKCFVRIRLREGKILIERFNYFKEGFDQKKKKNILNYDT